MNEKDFWARHKVGVRFMTVVLTLSFLAIVVSSVFGVPVTPEVLYVVSGITLFVYATIALGADGVTKIIEIIIIHVKGKK